MVFALTDFQPLRPPFEIPQSEVLEWLVQAHRESAKRQGFSLALQDEIREKVKRYGCAEHQVSCRASVLKDFTHQNWDEMEIYHFREGPEGAGIGERNRFFAKAVRPFFERLFPEGMEAPDDLIHVTCTGYLSPSEAQNLIDRRGWGEKTTATHAYHMGCYAAFPGLRLASGFLSHPASFSPRLQKKRRVEVAHTELCSLHLNPAEHTPEQLVVQSLFSDGFIRYAVVNELPSSGLEILALKEAIVRGTEGEMTWALADHGMEMTLSRQVPVHLAAQVKGFLEKLFAQAGENFDQEKERAHFAVHPGGPLIIDLIQNVLELNSFQVALSREVLFRFGNMSSATLPHIWQAIVENREIPSGCLVVSLAFGPGLTVCGGLFRKL
ncbi:MAG: 3-oxoacyl-[acyl-carrier-protein] synthase III C-terminal domain-containing protein [bacterium]